MFNIRYVNYFTSFISYILILFKGYYFSRKTMSYIFYLFFSKNDWLAFKIKFFIEIMCKMKIFNKKRGEFGSSFDFLLPK